MSVRLLSYKSTREGTPINATIKIERRSLGTDNGTVALTVIEKEGILYFHVEELMEALDVDDAEFEDWMREVGLGGEILSWLCEDAALELLQYINGDRAYDIAQVIVGDGVDTAPVAVG